MERKLIVYDFEGNDETSIIQSYFKNPQDFKPQIVEPYNFWYNMYAYILGTKGLDLLPYSAYALLRTMTETRTAIDDYTETVVISSNDTMVKDPRVKFIKKGVIDSTNIVTQFALLDTCLLENYVTSLQDGFRPIASDTVNDQFAVANKTYNISNIIDAVIKAGTDAIVSTGIEYAKIIHLRMGVIIFFLYGLYQPVDTDSSIVRYVGKHGLTEETTVRNYVHPFIYSTVTNNFQKNSMIKENVIDLPSEDKQKLILELEKKQGKDDLEEFSISLLQNILGM